MKQRNSFYQLLAESSILNINCRNSFMQLLAVFVLLYSPLAPAGGSILDRLVDDAPKQRILPPDVAFQLALTATHNNEVNAAFTIEPGHYLYKNRINFESDNATILAVELPKGEIKEDPNFGIQTVYHHSFIAKIKLGDTSGLSSIHIKAKYQGCSEQGLCYAPIRKAFTVVSSTQVARTNNPLNDALDNPANILQSGNLWLIVAGFFVAGLLLSLTPCVLPMIPILSSIIVGSQNKQDTPSKLHAFLLSVAYVLGMALSYTLAGIAAGLSGSLISQSLQNAWVLGATAIVFILLSLSMFGFYELKLPTSIESKMLNTSNQLKGGQFFGVFIMGALSALIVSPCVAAPLAGALLYIGQTHNVLLGGVGLFALAIGMGVPLLIIGASAGQLLPKSGAWMTTVRNCFGVLMLGMAIWIVAPLLPHNIVLGLWAALCIVTAVYLHALDALPVGYRYRHQLGKGLGVLLLVYGAALMVGALSGGQSVFQPLKHLSVGGNAVQRTAANPASHLQFIQVSSVDALKQHITNAGGKPVMLDFYADWCVACKEMESQTFTNATVQGHLKDTILLQADVTAHNEDDQALLAQFGLYGPPGIIFFDQQGDEMKSITTIGFENVEKFTKTLQKRKQCLVASAESKGGQQC